MPNKQVFGEKLLVELHDQSFYSEAMYKFKIKFLYNEEELFCSENDFINLKTTLPLAKLGMVDWLNWSSIKWLNFFR